MTWTQWPFSAAWYFFTKLIVIKKQGLMPLVRCRDRRLTTDLYCVKFQEAHWSPAIAIIGAPKAISVPLKATPSHLSSQSQPIFFLDSVSWIPSKFLNCPRCIPWNLFFSSLSLLFSVCSGSKLNWVMISWRYMTAPICSHLWLDHLTALKFHSSSLVAVTFFICYSPLITVDQTVDSRYSMKVRICHHFIVTFTWCQLHKAKGFIWGFMHVGAARMVLLESVVIIIFCLVWCEGFFFLSQSISSSK